MTTSDSDLDDLRRRVERLEAKEAVLATFNEYLYCLDIGYPGQLVERVFLPEAVLEVINFPPGSMDDLRFEGRDGILPLYDEHTVGEPLLAGGHHAVNIGINVAPDLSGAELSAYFLTAGPTRPSVQGGMYQVIMRPVDRGAVWQVERMKIISSWGWRATETERITHHVPATRADREGRPITWDHQGPSTA